MVLCLSMLAGLVFHRNSLTRFMMKMQQNQAEATARCMHRQQVRDERMASLEELLPRGRQMASMDEQLVNIEWPENGTAAPTFTRRNSMRDTVSASNCRGDLCEAFSVQSVGAVGTSSQDDYQTIHRTSGSIRPRPQTIHEASAPNGTYSRIVSRD